MRKTFRNPWLWVPTLYLFQGIPYSIVQTTSLLIYKTMGISVGALAFWTSLLYLPWAIKPLWSPYVEVVSTKRNWILVTQLILGVTLIAAGSIMPLGYFFPLSLCIFAIIAISSASHDIAADGFYMHALDKHNQAFFVGIRSTFYRIALLVATGLIPLIAGLIQAKTGLEPATVKVYAVSPETYQKQKAVPSESGEEKQPDIILQNRILEVPLFSPGASEVDSAITSVSLSAPPDAGEKITLNIMFKSGSKDIKLAKDQNSSIEFTDQNWNQPVMLKFHVDKNLSRPAFTEYRITAGNISFSWMMSLIALGVFMLLIAGYHQFYLPQPVEIRSAESVNLRLYGDVLVSFFRKPGIIPALLFFLLYRFGEAQSMKIATPFLVDSPANGGIGLTSAQYGIIYGTVGMIALTVGGILGGVLASKFGLKKLIWFMALGMNLPNIGLFFIATVQPMPGDWSVYAAVIMEQFGYGFGFTAYMLFMLLFVGDSKYKTAEYAICTSIMAFGMLLPGIVSGFVQEWLGYRQFFIYVLFCTLPGMSVIPFLKIDPTFGLKTKD